MVLATFATVFAAWGRLPEAVPVHFGFSGKPDAWGAKGLLWLLPVLSAILVLGLSWASRFPHKFNYLVTITETNAQRQYQIAVSLLRWLKAAVAALFLALTAGTLQVGLGQAERLDGAFAVAIVAAILATVAVFLVRCLRAR